MYFKYRPDRYISICMEATHESLPGGKRHVIAQWPRVTETRALSTISGWGREKSRSLPFLTAFPRSGVTSPGVDHHGVILLSVAASLTLTLTDILFFPPAAPVYHSFPELARAWMFSPSEFSNAVQITAVKIKAHTIAVRTMNRYRTLTEGKQWGRPSATEIIT